MTDRIGQQLGNYRLTRLLGQGGFAEVYLGEHVLLGSTVAIKLLHTRVTEDEITKFQQEARLLAGLKHPHIIRILDFGISEQIPYLVMDYAPNGTLRKRHAQGTQLSAPTVIDYVKQIANALQYAHDNKIVHRDVKPENMLIGDHGEILLGDFGIALIAQSSHDQGTKDMAGTIAYMAPEQIKAHPRPASDQYALGIVVYEWLCGTRPFQGSYPEIAVKHSVTPPLPLRSYQPTLSPDIEHVVLTALAKEPGARFPSVSAFAKALEQACENPLRTEPIPTSGRSSPSQDGAIGLVPPPHAETSEHTNAYPAEPTQKQLTPSTASITSSPTDRQQIVHPQSPPASHPPFPQKRRPGRKSLVLIGGALGLILLLTIPLMLMRGIIPLPVGTSPTVTQRSTPTPGEGGPLSTDTVSGNARWSTLTAIDGVVYVGPAHNQVYAIDTTTRQKKWTFPTRNATSHIGGNWLQPSPTVANGVVYFGSGDKTVYALDAKTGTQKWTFPVGDEVDSSPTVTNGVLYVGCIDRNIYAIDTNTGQKKWTFTTNGEVHLSPTVANGVVYVSSNDSSVSAIDAQSGKKIWVFSPGSSGQSFVSSPPMVVNGVVYIGSPGDNKIYAINAKTGQPKWSFFMGWNGFISTPMVANGVLYVASIDGKIYAIEAETGQKKWAFPANGGVYAALTVANGAAYVISIDGIVYAIDTTTGHQKWVFPTKNATGSWEQPPPIVVNGVLYVASDDSNVYAINTTTGQQKWAAPVDSHGWSLPLVVNNMLYITGSYDGNVYVIDTTTGQYNRILST